MSENASAVGAIYWGGGASFFCFVTFDFCVGSFDILCGFSACDATVVWMRRR